MGKSMLADWLVGQAEQAGMQVARGACSAAGMPPLWPWRRSLAAIGLELPWREERAAAGPSDRELVAAAIVETVAAAAARQPLLIVLEDMHWSDPVSVLVAQAAAEAVAALPLALLLTCRDERDEATHEVRDRLAELPASVRRMLLPPLDADAVAALAGSIALALALDNQVAAGLQARTGGNPFFAHEVARLIAARGPAAALMVPPGVREVLQRRLARLSQPCVSLLTAAAIVAETAAEAIEDDLLQHVSGVGQEAAAQLLDEAAAGLLLDVDHGRPVAVPVPARAGPRGARSRLVRRPARRVARGGRRGAGAAGQPAGSRRPGWPTTGPARPARRPRRKPRPGRCGRRGTRSPDSASRPRWRITPARLPAARPRRSRCPSSSARHCRCAATSPQPGRYCWARPVRPRQPGGPATWPGPRSPSAAAWPASRSRCRTRSRRTCCGRPMRHCRQARPRCGPRCAAGCRWRWPARHRRRTGWRWRRMRSGWHAPPGTG